MTQEVPAAAPGVVAGQRGDGGRARGLVALAFAIVGVLVVGGSYIATTRKKEESRAQVAGMDAPQGIANAPENAPSKHYTDLIEQNNRIKLNEAQANGQPIVLAPLVGGGDPAPPPAPVVQLNTPPPKAPKDTKGEVARRVAALSALGKRWSDLPGTGVIAGVASSTRRAEATDGSAHAAGQASPAPPDLPLLQVMHGVIDVGANSDYPSELIARLTDGPLPGAKFLGHADSRSLGNGGVDRLTMRFTKMLYKGTFYDVDAIAVDPGSRIPAVEGQVNHHIVHNVVFNMGADFLLGFASAARSSNPYLGITIGANGAPVVDRYNSAQAVQAVGAQTVAGTLQQGTFRGPTVTLPAGSAIGLVLIAPLRSPALASFPNAAPAPGTPNAIPSSAAPVGRGVPPPAVLHTTAPDGTPITIGQSP